MSLHLTVAFGNDALRYAFAVTLLLLGFSICSSNRHRKVKFSFHRTIRISPGELIVREVA